MTTGATAVLVGGRYNAAGGAVVLARVVRVFDERSIGQSSTFCAVEGEVIGSDSPLHP